MSEPMRPTSTMSIPECYAGAHRSPVKIIGLRPNSGRAGIDAPLPCPRGTLVAHHPPNHVTIPTVFPGNHCPAFTVCEGLRAGVMMLLQLPGQRNGCGPQSCVVVFLNI
eukprot:692468-Pyramimonas_sp.AAC.1